MSWLTSKRSRKPKPSSISDRATSVSEWLDRLETASKGLGELKESLPKGAKDVIQHLPSDVPDSWTEAIEHSLPWFEAVAHAAGPAKFLVAVYKELTKIDDPRELCMIACTVAYQKSASEALIAAGAPKSASSIKDVTRPLGEATLTDPELFSQMTMEAALSHPFVKAADSFVEFYARRSGFSDGQIRSIVAQIHGSYEDTLRLILTEGGGNQKYQRVRDYLSLGADGSIGRATIRRHIRYQRWLFDNAPVLDIEPYTLRDVFIEPDAVEWTGESWKLAEEARFQSARGIQHQHKPRTERTPALAKIEELILDPTFSEAILIEGGPGTGKSTITKALTARLAEMGLIPIRLRFRDIDPDQEFWLALNNALNTTDALYEKYGDGDVSDQTYETTLGPELLTQSVSGSGHRLCPYVFLFDGWDEVSLGVGADYRQKLARILSSIRTLLDQRQGRPHLRILLTGRPSDATELVRFLAADSRILSLLPFTPDQIESFDGRLRQALDQTPVRGGQKTWSMPPRPIAEKLLERYRRFYGRASKGHDSEIIGIPFLAQLTFRVLSSGEDEPETLVANSTTLLRRVVEIVIHDADVPTDQIGRSAKGRKIQARLKGDRLRTLLRLTAERMTIGGTEILSRDELSRFLTEEGVIPNDAFQGTTVLSELIASFYFKAGPWYGCEFQHKSLREYLFAEAIIEVLRDLPAELLRLGRANFPLPHLRGAFSVAFEESDPSRLLAQRLVLLLGPQWMSPEVLIHVERLLKWEIGRAGTQAVHASETSPLPLQDWIHVRDGLAEVWEWWCDGVPMRPAPLVDTDGTRPPMAHHDGNLFAEVMRRLQPSQGSRPQQSLPSTTEYDAHFGYALIQMCAMAHHQISTRKKEKAEQEDLMSRISSTRRSQPVEDHLRFRPSRGLPGEFALVCSRINSARGYPYANTVGPTMTERMGGRPAATWSAFPMHAKLPGAKIEVDLSGTDFTGATLSFAVLEGEMKRTVFNGARCDSTLFAESILEGSFFRETDLRDAHLEQTDLSGSEFMGAQMENACLNETALNNASFRNASMIGATFVGADTTDANFQNAKIDRGQLTKEQWDVTAG